MSLATMTNFAQRLTVGSAATVLALAILYFSNLENFKPYFVLLIAGLASVALWEFYNLAAKCNYRPLARLGVLFAFIYVETVYFAINSSHIACGPLAVLMLAMASAAACFFYSDERPLDNVAMTLFGMLYVVVPLAFVINIAYLPVSENYDGRLWLLYLLLVTKVSDVGAYVFGKLLQGPKLAPVISPKKTISGAIGGLAVSMGASFFYTATALNYGWSLNGATLAWSIVLGVCLGVVAQFGDLVESLFKRAAKIKDSSTLPGLGGVLDMVDSLIFTAPLLYFYLCWQLL